MLSLDLPGSRLGQTAWFQSCIILGKLLNFSRSVSLPVKWGWPYTVVLMVWVSAQGRLGIVIILSFKRVKDQGRSIFSGKPTLFGLLVPRLLSLHRDWPCSLHRVGRESQFHLGKQLGCYLFPDLQVNILDYRINRINKKVAGIFSTAFCWSKGGDRSTGQKIRGSVVALAFSMGERRF